MTGETSENWTVRDVLAWTAGRFAKSGVPSPRLNAELLLAHVLKLPARLELLLEPDRKLSDAERQAYRECVKRRLDREPTAHIMGYWGFYKRDFRLSRDVLTPRSETEIVADAAISWARANGARQALDLGTGSGCLGVTLALEVPGLTVTVTDVSEKALETARANAGQLMADGRVRFLPGDLFDALPATGDGAGPFDMIVSNPPYIPSAEIEGLMPEVSRYEPRLALDGGADGLDFYRRLAAGCAARLKPGGALFLEIGAGQGGAVGELFRSAGSYGNIEISKDLAGLERVLSAVRM